MVSEEWVEVALSAFFEQSAKWPDELAPEDQPFHRRDMRAALSAVRPLIEAEVIEKCAKVAETYDPALSRVDSTLDDIATAIRALKEGILNRHKPMYKGFEGYHPTLTATA